MIADTEENKNGKMEMANIK